MRLGYIKTVEAGKRWSTTVALRNSNDLCNAAVKFAEPLGTQVIYFLETSRGTPTANADGPDRTGVQRQKGLG